jgi:hypothetical protein
LERREGEYTRINPYVQSSKTFVRFPGTTMPWNNSYQEICLIYIAFDELKQFLAKFLSNRTSPNNKKGRDASAAGLPASLLHPPPLITYRKLIGQCGRARFISACSSHKFSTCEGFCHPQLLQEQLRHSVVCRACAPN